MIEIIMSIIIYQILGKAGKDRYSEVDLVDIDLIDEKYMNVRGYRRRHYIIIILSIIIM